MAERRFLIGIVAFTVGLIGIGLNEVEAQSKAPVVAPKAPGPSLIRNKDLQPTINKPVELSDDELFQLQQKYKDLMATKKFDEALATIEKLPESTLSRPQKQEFQTLRTFRVVEERVASSSSLFQKDDELDEATKKSVQKLYKEAQAALLNSQQELAKDILIQVLFLHRQNLRAKILLEEALDLKSGAYKIENMEAKYWNKSSVNFYAGNYQQAVDVLTALSFFDKDNPVVYERMGSAYYMMGEKEKAISAWNTCLFLDPSNKDLEEVIKRTQELIAEEKEAAKAQKAKPRSQNVIQGETQLMGKFPNQNQAYDYANTLRKQGVDAVVSEEDDGKWAVRVPKKK
ncbi:hypothetical protein EBR96_00550 [bacterium]|nr:hypothetical protein [bacterium]